MGNPSHKRKGFKIMKKRSVSLIIHKLTSGGAQKMLANLSLYLSEYYDVHVIVFDGHDQTYETGGQLHDLNLKPAKNKLKQIHTFVKRIKLVKEIKKENGIECSISFLDGPNLVNYLSSNGEKIIVSVRSFLSLTTMNSLRKFYTKYVSNRATCTVAISDMVKLDLINNFGIIENKLCTIYNACDVESITKQSLENLSFKINKTEDVFYFVTVGRLTEAKGHWHLLRSFSKLCKENYNVKLVIIGNGELEEKTKKLCNALNLDNKVIFTGFQINPHAIVKQCDVFVFSSIFEGFGNVIVDALALSKPVIASDCMTGPRNILAPDTDLNYQTKEIEYAEYGILVPCDDKKHFNCEDELSLAEEKMAQAMKEIYENVKLRDRYSKNVAKRADDFSVATTVKEWITLIEKSMLQK